LKKSEFLGNNPELGYDSGYQVYRLRTEYKLLLNFQRRLGLETDKIRDKDPHESCSLRC
jgi:hypothetical protein